MVSCTVIAQWMPCDNWEPGARSAQEGNWDVTKRKKQPGAAGGRGRSADEEPTSRAEVRDSANDYLNDDKVQSPERNADLTEVRPTARATIESLAPMFVMRYQGGKGLELGVRDGGGQPSPLFTLVVGVAGGSWIANGSMKAAAVAAETQDAFTQYLAAGGMGLATMTIGISGALTYAIIRRNGKRRKN